VDFTMNHLAHRPGMSAQRPVCGHRQSSALGVGIPP
jgi:hypothetical protein